MTKDPERAEKLRRGKLLLKIRETLIHVKIDDEGDRVYLRSTNDADVLKGIIAEIDDYGWQEFMREKGDPDINIFEECRKANALAAKLQDRVAVLEMVIFEELTDCDDAANQMIVDGVREARSPALPLEGRGGAT